MVLNTGDGTLGNPVDFNTTVKENGRGFVVITLGDIESQVVFSEFFGSQVEERGHAVGIVGGDDFEVRSEDIHSVLVGFGISELLAVHFLVGVPLGQEGFVLNLGVLVRDSQEGSRDGE